MLKIMQLGQKAKWGGSWTGSLRMASALWSCEALGRTEDWTRRTKGSRNELLFYKQCFDIFR